MMGPALPEPREVGLHRPGQLLRGGRWSSKISRRRCGAELAHVFMSGTLRDISQATPVRAQIAVTH